MTGQQFGDVLRSHREHLHLTQEELAHWAGLGVRTIRELEAGRVLRPRGHSLRLLAQALGLDEDARTDFISRAYAVAQPLDTGEPSSSVPRQLPADVAGFVGRRDVLKALEDALHDGGAGSSAVGIAVIVGMAGIGKTAVAARWAHSVADRFPDGALYVDLRGYSAAAALRPIDALARFLRALGVPAERVPVDQDETAALYRSVLGSRRMLVVLDNAASAEQIRPLLPGTGGSFVLVTSRDQLTGLMAREGARQFTLGGLEPAESQELLASVLGAERIAADSCAAERLAHLCAHLPLALRIAAANLAIDRESTIAEFAEKLARDRLAALHLPGDEDRAVLAAFDLSYRAQPAAARRMFRLLGLVPGPDFTVEVAAPLAGVAVGDAASLLDRLVGVHLVQRLARGRYSMHDLLRHFAQDRVASEPDRAEAVNRLLDYYLAATDAAADRLYPYMFRLEGDARIKAVHPGFADDNAAIGWLDAEHHNVIAAIDETTQSHPATACALAVALRGYLWFRGCALNAVRTADAALAGAADDGTIAARTAAEITAAMAYFIVGDHARAARHGDAAVCLARQAGIKSAEAPALANLGPILLRAGEPRAAAERALEALTLARECGRRGAEGPIQANLTVAYRELGRLHDAADTARAAVAIDRECGSLVNEGLALTCLGEVCHLLGDLDEAATYLQRSLAIARQIGNLAFEAPALAALGAVLADQGRLAQAADAATTAITAMADQDHWTEVECRNTLAGVMHHLGRHRDAVDEHTRALDLTSGAERSAPAVVALIGLSEAHHVLGDLQEAAACASEALQISHEVGYRVLEGQAHLASAQAALATEQRDIAAEHATRAIDIQHSCGHRLGEARARIVLGHTDPHHGTQQWQNALAIFERCGAVPDATATAQLIRDSRADRPESAG
jgi:tetratricopeptide (TPR) repeat protein/transcriptional regulator with XRE-family HTH domain